MMPSLIKNKLNLFYLLALAPLPLIQYSGYVKRGDLVTWIIPFYAFLILFIKKDKLSAFANQHTHKQTTPVLRIIGLVLILTSFFAYYGVVQFHPPAQFYGAVNYTLHIIGLFLIFFEAHALREAFTPVFLIVGATALPYLGKEMEALLEPAIPFFTQSVVFILRMLGLQASIGGPTRIVIESPNSPTPIGLGLIPACIGIYSFATFSIVIIITLIEDRSDLRTKLFWSIGGIIGTFFVNIIRVALIFVVIYFFGYEGWTAIHAPIGYILFLVWLALFFIAFSNRQAIKSGVQALSQKIRHACKMRERTQYVAKT